MFHFVSTQMETPSHVESGVAGQDVTTFADGLWDSPTAHVYVVYTTGKSPKPDHLDCALSFECQQAWLKTRKKRHGMPRWLA